MPMTAGQGFTRAMFQAEALPLPSVLSGGKFKIRRGQLVMVAGASGAGKSMFTTWLVHEIGLPALYGSADMDPFDATVRLAAMVTGNTQESIERSMLSCGEAYYSDMLSDCKIQLFFDSTPELSDVVSELDAYVEVWDAFPDVLVLDNLVNIQDSGEYQGKMHILSELHHLAHTYGITVFILHHALESNNRDASKPAGKKDIDSKVTHYPELVLTVALDQSVEQFHVACVKQRGGKADATGKTFLTLAADPARCSYTTAHPSTVSDWWKEVE